VANIAIIELLLVAAVRKDYSSSFSAGKVDFGSTLSVKHAGCGYSGESAKWLLRRQTRHDVYPSADELNLSFNNSKPIR